MVNESVHSTRKDPNLNFFQKIFWRFSFVVKNIFFINFRTLLLSLKPSNEREVSKIFDILKKKKILSLVNNWLIFREYKFCFKPTNLDSIIPDFISIWGDESRFIKNNFLNNQAFYFEMLYEDNQVKIDKGDYVIDAGANIGLFSVLASEKIGETGKVFAFEPVKQVRQYLRDNIRENKVKNVEIFDFALGKEKGKIDFYLTDILGGCSGHFKDSGEKISVDVKTIDEFVQDNKIEKVDFIKADIEGMERELLLGAKDTIKKFRPKLSICVYHLSDDKEIIPKIIKDINSEYIIHLTETKLYAY